MKVAKFRILKPLDAEWKDLGAVMRAAQQQNASAMNHVMTSMYIDWSHNHSKKNGYVRCQNNQEEKNYGHYMACGRDVGWGGMGNRGDPVGALERIASSHQR